MARMRVRAWLFAAAGVVAAAVFGGVMGPAPASPFYGPLAVAAAGDGGPPGVTVPREVTGTLRTTVDCVTLATGDGEALLVWPAGRARWHPHHALITVQRPGGGIAVLSAGDRVLIAGEESRADAGGLEADEWVAAVAWASPPGEGCVGARRLWVGDVVRLP